MERRELIRMLEEDAAWLEYSPDQHPADLTIRYLSFDQEALEAMGGEAGQALKTLGSAHVDSCSGCKQKQQAY